MSFSKKAFFSISAALPLQTLFRRSGIPVLFPYQHVVSDDNLLHIRHLYNFKNTKQFVNDLDWLLQHFKPIHPDDVAKHFFSGQPLNGPSFLLSFDDGYREVYDVIAPILEKKGIPAIFFINPAFIDNKELFYRCKLSLVLDQIIKNEESKRSVADFLQFSAASFVELRNKILEINFRQQQKAEELGNLLQLDFNSFLAREKPFLSVAQIKELVAKGFVFGAHSWNHPDYALLNLEEQIQQTQSSLRFTRDIAPAAFQYFSFPHQDKLVSADFFTQILGEEKNLLMFGLQNQLKEKNCHMQHRYNGEDPGKSFASVTKGVLLYNALLRIKGKRQVERK